jgi:IS5 family transposase
LRSRRKGGIQKNALGRSRGGFSTKIHARTNADGLPIGIVITPGQAHDVTAYPALMAEVDADPERMLADKGYDSDTVRKDIQDRGGEPVIPTKANRKQQIIVQKAIYGLRNRIDIDQAWRLSRFCCWGGVSAFDPWRGLPPMRRGRSDRFQGRDRLGIR